LASLNTNMWFRMIPTTRSRDTAHAHYSSLFTNMVDTKRR